MTRIIQAFSEISNRYEAAFVDLWGCVHNGVTAYPAAVAALQAYRDAGGTVVLVTNAPRPRASVARQLQKMDVPENCYDLIATSGDAARLAMFRGAVGRKVWFMGENHDLTFFSPPAIIDDPVEIERVDLNEAEGIVCCGPFDPHADPAVNRPEFLVAKQKGLKLLCANPDIVVDRGDSREWCAGALAELYEEMGGESLYFGKPHPPIYDLARRRMAAEGLTFPDAKIICVGDGIHTDIQGAIGEDLDSLFITGGLASEETGTDGQPDKDKLESYLDDKQLSPTYAIGKLR